MNLTVPGVINDRWALNLTPDRAVFHAERPTWEAERLDVLYDHVHDRTVVYDIGAECGDFTALYRSWGAHVVAVEPQPAYWPAIKAHWEANIHPNQPGLPAGFVGFCAASTDLEPPRCDIRGPLALLGGGWPPCADGPVIPDFGFRHLAQQTDATPRIELDNLMRAAYLDGDEDQVVTIDVEGAELEVLRGAAWLLEHVHPTVFVSASPDVLEEWYGSTLDDLHGWMDRFGYQATLLADTHEQHWVYQ